MKVLSLAPDLEVGFIGPPLEKGPVPTAFYYALSTEESLEVDPYNQPAVHLARQGVRVFSLNLPAHGPHLNATEALKVWAEEFLTGSDPVAPFLQKARRAMELLIEQGHIKKGHIGLMGLSRGGLIASLLAAEYPVAAVVGFAPMTQLTYAKEFGTEATKASDYTLSRYVEKLCQIKVRYYMGNRDLRVGTDQCFSLVLQLADAAYAKGSRSPPIELVVSPSIGHLGHGTGKDTFEAGADWLKEQIEGGA